VLGAVFEGFAVVLLISITLRHAFGLHHLVTDRHLDLLAKLLLAFGLMTAYGYVFEAFGAWYSGDEFERDTLFDRWGGAYAWAYWGAVLGNFAPLQALWFRAIRYSSAALVVVAASVTLGMWLERFMLVESTLYRDFLPAAWQVYVPSFWEGHLRRHDRPVLFPIFPVHPAPADDLDVRAQGGVLRGARWRPPCGADMSRSG
jgi:hypothetical protein